MNPSVIKFLFATGFIGVFVIFTILQQNENVDMRQDDTKAELNLESKVHELAIAKDKANFFGVESDRKTGEFYKAQAEQLEKEIKEQKIAKLEAEKVLKLSKEKSQKLLKDVETGINAFSEEELNAL